MESSRPQRSCFLNCSMIGFVSVTAFFSVAFACLSCSSVEGFSTPSTTTRLRFDLVRLEVTNGQDGVDEMSTQERVLRNAGLWDEKAQSEKAEKARIAKEEQQQQIRRNLLVAVVSIGLAVGNYFWTYTRSLSYMASSATATSTAPPKQIINKAPLPLDQNLQNPSLLDSPTLDTPLDQPDDTDEIMITTPDQTANKMQLPYSQNQPAISPLQLLARMTDESDPISIIGTNGKPTIVDFWAPWCDNCKLAAPTLSKIEAEYKGKVNFVMINCDGNDNARSWAYIKAFGVDAIPHLALVSADGDVETALIGPIPKTVLEADFNVLIENANNNNNNQKKELPYTMLDVFANKPDKRRVSFDR